MKRILICLSLVLEIMMIAPLFTAAENVAMPITGWEASFWQYGDAAGLTENGTGIEVTGDEAWVQNGSGALHVWCETSRANLNAQAVQQISQLTAGKEYRLTGKLYISRSSWGFGLYTGEKRLVMLSAIAAAGAWSDIDYSFTFDASGKDFKIQVAQQGDLYADDLSLREVLRDEAGNITGYGGELLQNGGFEDDFIPPADVTNLKAQAYSNAVELSWVNPDDSNLDNIIVMQDGVVAEEVGAERSAVIIDGLENGKEYIFTVKTKSKTGVMSEGVQISATPVKHYELPAVIKDDVLDRIVGLTEDMEYSTDGGASWVRYDGITQLDLSGNITVLVRMYAEDDGAVTPELALYFTAAAEDGDEIKLTKAVINGNKFIAEGVLNQQTQATVTMLLINKDADRRDLSKILAVGQVKSGADGSFEFSVDIADKRLGEVNDGEYVVYIDSSVTDEISKDGLIFVNSEKRAEAIAALWENENPYALLEPNSEYYDAYVCIGLPVQEYNQSAGIKTGVISDFIKLRDAADKAEGEKALTEAFTKALVINILKNADASEVYQTLVKYNGILNLSCGNSGFEELLQNNSELVSWICSYMAGKLYNEAADIDARFAEGYALYLINNATYGNISDIIAAHKQTLGISGSAYERYASLSAGSDEKIYISKKLVLAKTSSPFKSAEAIIKAISDAAASYTPTGGGGGGSGSGSSSSGSSGTYTVSPANTSNTEVQPAGSVFSDLENARWAEEAINYLYQKGIVSGSGENMFEPQREITREEFVSILVRAFGIAEDKTPAGFNDVDEQAWYYTAVTSAANAGIISGVGENEFGIGRNITRQDIAVMLYRCLNISDIGSLDEIDFTDINDISEYANAAVLTMKKLGYISGYTDGSFMPAKTATRAEASQILYSILTDERNAK